MTGVHDSQPVDLWPALFAQFHSNCHALVCSSGVNNHSGCLVAPFLRMGSEKEQGDEAVNS
eukprot:2769089-Alexandrium_andersonii.AAC.1